MALPREEVIADIRAKYCGLSHWLNEKNRRLWAATEARSYGWGGITVVSQATGVDPKTVRKGILELDDSQRPPDDRIRRKRGGRKKLTDTYKGLLDDLESLLEPVSRGDPQSPLQWTSRTEYVNDFETPVG